jgi:DNA gyrase subunit A
MILRLQCVIPKLALHPTAEKLLENIDEDTIDFIDNFDASVQEPVVLPARIPNLLINGSQGIAVGLATNIPPHNAGEVIAGAIHMLDNEEATVNDLMKYIKGPDFPTGALILGVDGLKDAYKKGKGSLRVRGEHAIEENKGKTAIVINAVPYQVSIESIAEKAAEAVEAGTIQGVKDIRNESGQGKTRLVIDLKPGADANVILNNLYKHTPMQTTIPMNMLALVDGVPKTLRLDEFISQWINHQKEVISRRSQYRLDKCEARYHILEGLLRAVDMIDEIIALIRASKDRGVAREKLQLAPFDFSEIQSNHILDLALGRLTELGQKELAIEAKALKAMIKELKALLRDPSLVLKLLKDDLNSFLETIDKKRKTKIEKSDTGDIDTTSLVMEEDLIVNVTARNYIRAINVASRSAKITSTKDNDVVKNAYELSSLDSILVVTNFGRAYRINCHEINRDKLVPVSSMITLSSGEIPLSIVNMNEAAGVVLISNTGGIKRVDCENLRSIATRKDGVVCAKLGADEKVVSVCDVYDDDDHQMLVVTKNGQGIRFPFVDLRATSRSAGFVRAIKLKADDEVVGAISVFEDDDCVISTDKGYAKRMRVSNMTLQSRAGSGMRAMKIQPSRGKVNALCLALGELTAFVSDVGSVSVDTVSISLQDREGSGVKVKGLSGDVSSIYSVADAVE